MFFFVNHLHLEVQQIMDDLFCSLSFFYVFDFAFGETVCPEKVARESGAEATAVSRNAGLPRPPNFANPPRSVWTASGSPPLSQPLLQNRPIYNRANCS